MGLTACSEAPAVTPKERQALLRLEMAFVKGLKAEKMIQQKYRIVGYIIVFINIISTIYLYNYVQRERSEGLHFEHVYIKDVILPLSTILLMMIFFSNNPCRSNLMSARIYLKRLNNSLNEFNLYFCGRRQTLYVVD
ncbi:conserved Plasmodium protein, unknown function [Babesia microti strain RI]|uniref:Uncharacterized protein n=1 Tax=Babesia microti (strain RI) TaxID=1133968 RepID=A0A1N6LXC5_BABMR|nr:conserved Plasmodium protein, unknown function [Babesia microti strain RI]SIO73530.1 conserved Plasmodium protein, unknown function [Babesia microti strain RI]|eukprot:XP_021337622.1 conserved Plasmodium protein, unknown function [Babesia microti strain RI]